MLFLKEYHAILTSVLSAVAGNDRTFSHVTTNNSEGLVAVRASGYSA